ncbi:16S rRNA (guanine(966)-N(2))-methyltransferase RsmD [Arthrobacter sp. NPDC089319]|uniref:16S rRNA (guanine(966)-N(2))-methyltransferase RsmD n=1 Tax=Arthrobacter sp. NPDC089319 TaxID=3155915 RepID=UPI00342F45D8
MSRIVAGVAGGLTLASVPGDNTRPTTDRVKEALFSRLESYDILVGARVLDLFAGSGALGVESASRGAATVDLVEAADKAAAVCRRNADMVNEKLGRKTATVHRMKAERFLEKLPAGQHWDLVLMDPPYPLGEDALGAVLRSLSGYLADGAVVVVERSSRSQEPAWPHRLVRFAVKKYGETQLWFAEPVMGPSAPGE